MRLGKTIWLIFIGLGVSLWSCSPDPGPRSERSAFFVKMYGGLLQEEGMDLIQTSDGGYIMVGSSNTPGISRNLNKDVFIVKVNQFGDEEWIFSYGGDFDDMGRSVIEKSTQDGFVIAGTYGYSNGTSTAVLLEINPQGGLQNELIFNTETNFSTAANHVSEIMPDQYLVTGTTTDPSIISPAGDPQDIFTFLVDGGGILASNNEGWESFDFGIGGFINPVEPDKFLVMGTASDSPLSGDGGARSDNIVLYSLKLENGDFTSPISSPRFGVPGKNQRANDIRRRSGGYTVAGTSENLDGTEKDIFFLKLGEANLNGSPLDGSSLREIDLSGDDEGISVQELSNGQFIIAGNSTGFRRLDKSGENGDKEIFLIKLDSDGSVVPDWREDPRTFGFKGDDSAGKVIATSDGGFAVVGTITIDGSSSNDQNRNTMMCLIKTDSQGKLGED